MKEMFADADAGLWGLLIFFAIFVGVLLWVFRPGSGKKYEDYGEIPLNEDKDND